jgi:tetratricopeptide (TPR) repeat protein
MDSKKLAEIYLLILSLALSGCAAETCNLTYNQAVQKSSLVANNRGYILGQISESPESKIPYRTTEKPVLVNELEMNSIISVFSEALKKNPDYPGAYYNRAIAYYYKKNYEQSWRDVHKAESLGYVFSVNFIKSLQKASHRKI